MTAMEIINPYNGLPIRLVQGKLTDLQGNTFLIVEGVPRISAPENYTENFGVQWNTFDKTQLDREEEGRNLSIKRFFAETHWD